MFNTIKCFFIRLFLTPLRIDLLSNKKINFIFHKKNFDELIYIISFKDILDAHKAKQIKSGKDHFLNHGYKENRIASVNTLLKNYNSLTIHDLFLIACNNYTVNITKKNFNLHLFLKNNKDLIGIVNNYENFISHMKKNNNEKERFIFKEKLSFSSILSVLNLIFFIKLISLRLSFNKFEIKDIDYLYKNNYKKISFFKQQNSTLKFKDNSYKNFIFKNHGFYVDNCIIGSGNYIILDEKVIILKKFNFSEEIAAEEDLNFFKIENNICKFYSKPFSKNKKIKNAIIFTNHLSKEYAHWMYEILPTLLYYDTLDKFKEYPFIVNNNTNFHQNIKETLKFLNPSRKIIFIDNFEFINLKNCIIPERCSNAIYNLKSGLIKIKDFKHTGLYNQDAFDFLKNKLINKNKIIRSKKLLVLRTSNKRNALDLNKYFDLFRKNGYEFYYPEKDKFINQIYTFANAKEITIQGGAAVVNCIFCDKDTKINILVPDSNTNVDLLWENFLCQIGFQKINVIKCKIPKDELIEDYPFHSNYQIDDETINSLNLKY